MRIKIISEGNDGVESIEHEDVGEFFIFGNKKDEDGTIVNFHDWKGSFRYLIGSLYHFMKQVELERNQQVMNGANAEMRGQQGPRLEASRNLRLVQPDEDGEDNDGMPEIIKTIEAAGGLQVVEIDPSTAPVEHLKDAAEDEEMAVDEPEPEPRIQAEDS